MDTKTTNGPDIYTSTPMGTWNASDSLSFEPSIHLLEKKPTNAMSTSQYAKANKKEKFTNHIHRGLHHQGRGLRRPHVAQPAKIRIVDYGPI